MLGMGIAGREHRWCLLIVGGSRCRQVLFTGRSPRQRYVRPVTEQINADGAQAPTRASGQAFEDVAARGAVNYMIRNTQQQLVALSGQADFKASILITACSVVLTIGAAQAPGSDLAWGFGILAGFLLVSMVGAVLCVLPSFSPIGRKRGAPLDGGGNALFFGHFVQWDEDDYIDLVGSISTSDASVYRAQVRDLHQQGSFLVAHKYRYLRLGYGMFLAGFAIAAIVTTVGAASG
jgi:hypothetical protein